MAKNVAVDIDQRIKTGYYESKVPYPHRTDFVILEEVKTEKLGKQTLRGFDEEGYQQAYSAYRDDQNRLYAEFRNDALVNCGIIDHTKADRCFALAWEYGHDNGYHDVFNHLREFSELLKD